MSIESAVINIGFIGASRVNFGHTAKHPWNHALRIETFHRKGLYKINIIGIADIDIEKAENILSIKLKQYPLLYKSCKIYSNYEDMIENKVLNTVIIGVPPFVRGSLKNNMELKCLQKGIDLFIEKPLTNTTPNELLKYVKEIDLYQKYKGIQSRINPNRYPLISVGYMFRYHPIIQKCKEIINNYKQRVLDKFNMNINIQHISATYNSSYPFIPDGSPWWNENKSGGPIVEQGTHFIDLIRFFAANCNNNNNNNIFDADYDKDTLNVLAIKGDDKYNNLTMATDSYYKLDKNIRNPILTQCQFVMNTDQETIVSFTHSINLHHKKYKTKMEIWLDGLNIFILDPYQKISKLMVRESSLIKEEKCKEYEICFDSEKAENDPYYIELIHFFNNVIDKKNASSITPIYSDYIDSFKTYLLTYHIKLKSRNNHCKL